MSKVSKNLKKIRTSKKFTQDTLAEQLFVTRQTVSGWETGRTEPDIETLVKISEVLGVAVEELIYGERKTSNESEQSQKTKKIVSVLFAIIASVFTAVGIILIFVTGWVDFPNWARTVFSFMPMLISQAVVIFTYLKRKESVMWQECAAIIWCIGVASSVALLDSTFDVRFGFEACLFADIILLLPAIYLLDAVAPLIAYYSAAGTLGVFIRDNFYDTESLAVLILALTYLGGAYYTFKNRKNADDIRQAYSQWISALALAAFCALGTVLFFDVRYIFISLIAISLCFCLCEKNSSWANPLKTIGTVGILISSVIGGFLFCDNESFDFRSTDKSEIFFVILILVILSLTFVFSRKNLAESKTKRLFCILTLLESMLIIFNHVFMQYGNSYVYLLSVILAIAASLTLVAEGAINASFSALNLGLVSALILTGTLIFIFIDIDIFTTGILLLICGIVLFAVNFLLTKRLSKSKKEGDDNA